MKNSTKTKNKFDLLVESLSVKFSHIKDFQLLSKSESTQRVWNFLIQTIVELNSIKSCFIGTCIPQINKEIYEWKQEFLHSLYHPFLKIDEDLLEHEVSKLIRIGYVILIHKYENFAENVFKIVGANYGKFQDKSVSLQQYAIDKFDFRVNERCHKNNFLKKIDWISNSENHNDGYPDATHAYYKQEEGIKALYPELERIIIPADVLHHDIEFMIEFVQMTFQNVMLIALFKMAEESCNNFKQADDEFKKEKKDWLSHTKSKIDKIIDFIKEF